MRPSSSRRNARSRFSVSSAGGVVSADSASLAYRRRSRGFTTSSSPKPTIANPRTTKVIANPGGKKYHHIGGLGEWANEGDPWVANLPQLTVAPDPGRGPPPQKEKNRARENGVVSVNEGSARAC